MKNKKIAFVLYDYPLGVSTMIMNTIMLLRCHNDVVVFLNDDQCQINPCEPWLQSLIVPLVPGAGFASGIFSGLLKFTDRVRNAVSSRLCNLFSLPWSTRYWVLARFAAALRRKFSEVHYDVIVPVECFSLIAVDQAGAGTSDVVYFDMELLDWAKDNPLYVHKLELKRMQHKALQRVCHVMVTSPARASIFAEINEFNPDRMSVLPVLPLKRRQTERSLYFRDKFSIQPSCLVVVYAGNFMPWAQCEEIVKSMDHWPSNAVLVMHTWNQAALKSDYFELVRKAANGRPVYFSSDFLLYDQLGDALASADVGLLFYEGIDANFTEICFSSNKMAEYVAAGIPVIASPFPSLQKFIEQQGIGRAVPFEGIGDALREIAANHAIYRDNVKKCAATLFSFEEYYAAAWTHFEKSSRKLE